MKKILSFVLVLAMIASMMCVSVSAATCDQTGNNAHAQGYGVTLDGKKLDHVVGKRGHTGTNTDGAESANDTTDAMPIQASVSGETKNRYAVDLVYTAKTIAIGGDVIWDVNSLEYVGTKTISINNGTAENLTDGTAVPKIGEFMVTNYSNQSVWVTATVVNCPDGEGQSNMNGVDIQTVVKTSDSSYAANGTAISGNSATANEVAGVMPQVSTSGSPVHAYYQAEMTCDDWASNLWHVDGNLVIASITFTVTSTNPNQSSGQGGQASGT